MIARPPSRLWESALRHLHKLGWTDGRISRALADLPDEAIAELLAHPQSASRLVEDERWAGTGMGGSRWTAADVKRYRMHHQLWGNPNDDDADRSRAEVLQALSLIHI